MPEESGRNSGLFLFLIALFPGKSDGPDYFRYCSAAYCAIASKASFL